MFERKAYVYKFIDEKNNVLYIGKTVNMDKRMSQHFSPQSHLKKMGKGDIYGKIQRIEYLKCATEYDALVKELYYINYYKPPYNTSSKVKQIIPPQKERDSWRLYKIIKPLKKEIANSNTRIEKYLPLALLLFLASVFYFLAF
ncbi:MULTISPECIES: nucleotide excision repair endonuclease [Peptostreptococcaceae]|uniref:nucleotide excision repair endonuclease n=1 Tax=Peptostreptococcaceae TaxID=186804 RepID=UPI000820E1E2|nr:MULTISPECIES: nucleotide excision repair endonuclease [Peptostreptococcaceae]SCI50229.1 Excinuclease ABC subunit C [uncultured Clostridium sp.]MCE4921887.1 nucleotide excision repair endonuclease [Clostridioides difficile]MCH1964627.1 nucleotide excision repair endonuclease [Paeniclostridium sordellii]MDM0309425.1 nucleotide excision repair endonuclease [Clostridioides difficile]MDM0378953.1 nucleotide excision repair endonuclease [Clostridioides difficile]